MSVTSEDEADEDTVSRPHSHHSSSDSSNQHPNHDHNEYQDGQDDAYSSDEEGDDFPPPPPLSQHAFAPPFYGRPPTPLPPSPSLTSLLRPSRPTTPDASDDDGHGPGHSPIHHHPNSSHDHHPSAHHHHHHSDQPLPRARPKVPTYEYYGFVLYLFSSLSFLIYLLWSYLPSPFLHALGIYYYPNRWWSLAIPSFLVMLLVYIYVALAGYNLEILTLPLGSVETVVDEAAMVAVVDGRGRIVRKEGGKGGKGVVGDGEDWMRGYDGGGGGLDWKEVWNEGTDAVMDVPLAGVCEVLYGEGREWDSELEEDDVVITRV